MWQPRKGRIERTALIVGLGTPPNPRAIVSRPGGRSDECFHIELGSTGGAAFFRFETKDGKPIQAEFIKISDDPFADETTPPIPLNLADHDIRAKIIRNKEVYFWPSAKAGTYKIRVIASRGQVPMEVFCVARFVNESLVRNQTDRKFDQWVTEIKAEINKLRIQINDIERDRWIAYTVFKLLGFGLDELAKGEGTSERLTRFLGHIVLDFAEEAVDKKLIGEETRLDTLATKAIINGIVGEGINYFSDDAIELAKRIGVDFNIIYNPPDLRLLQSLKSINDLPTRGQNTIVLADLNGLLHFRLFENDGSMVVDTDEKRLAGEGESIKKLKKLLESMWPPSKPIRPNTLQAINAVTSITGYKLKSLEENDKLANTGASKLAFYLYKKSGFSDKLAQSITGDAGSRQSLELTLDEMKERVAALNGLLLDKDALGARKAMIYKEVMDNHLTE